MMNDIFDFHNGVRLGRILRKKKISVIRLAAIAGISRQWVYDNLAQRNIDKNRLVEILTFLSLTYQDFCCWNSSEVNQSRHQGEMLLTYIADNNLKWQKTAQQLRISLRELYNWGELQKLSTEQLQVLQTSIQLAPEYFSTKVGN